MQTIAVRMALLRGDPRFAQSSTLHRPSFDEEWRGATVWETLTGCRAPLCRDPHWAQGAISSG